MGSPQRVLVFGGAGFVGSHVAAYYDDQGATVLTFDNHDRGDQLEGHGEERRSTPSYNSAWLEREHPNVGQAIGDIRNFDRVYRIIDGFDPDAIVHVAGQTAVTSSLADPLEDFQVNAAGTVNILEAIRESDSDPTLVYASTNKVYGENVNRLRTANRPQYARGYYTDPDYKDGIPETFPVDNTEHSPYGCSKLAADQYVQDYARRGILDAAVFRMSCIYGPRQFGTEGQGWIAHFAISTMEQEPITIFGDGEQRRDVLFVSDLVRAYDAFLADPDGKSTVYNMGGGPASTTTVLGCLEMLEEVTGIEPDISHADEREADQDVYVSDIQRAIQELDWRPTVGFRDGLERFIEWYRSADMESPRPKV